MYGRERGIIPRPVHRPRPASTRAVYIVLLVAAIVFTGLIAGMWYTLAHDSGVTARFKAGLRLPQSVPDWLARSHGSYSHELSVRNDRMLPYLILLWEECSDIAQSPIELLLGLTYGELDVDLEGEQTPIEVDGVQGWLWHLGPLDFVMPYNREQRKALKQDWQSDRSVYIPVLDARYNPGFLSGQGIALQWNREGIHHLLIAKDREPMTGDVLLQIANSMAPSKYPSIAEIEGMSPRCPS